jgi:hypothetical protein
VKKKSDCAFCSSPATTVEHIIPKWLQRHYGLYDQQLRVWTGKPIHYRSAVIPACQHCNGVRLASLEKRIQNNSASARDYYLWALKIRYGLAIMDARLYIDPAHPEKGFLLPPDMVKYKAEFILPALASLDSSGFRFEPDPFGSVFVFEQEQDNRRCGGSPVSSSSAVRVEPCSRLGCLSVTSFCSRFCCSLFSCGVGEGSFPPSPHWS